MQNKRNPVGIRARHSSTCRSESGGRCNCRPSYEASVYSARDGKKLRKSFTSEAAARKWRADAVPLVSRGAMRAPTPTTVREAFEAFIVGARDGSVRTKAGAVYKPSVIRRWDSAMRVRRDGVSLLDELGGLRLADVDRNHLQDVVERMLGKKLDPSTIRNTINALRPVFRRAVARGELVLNPTTGLEIPAPKGRRLRVADPVEAETLIETAQPRDRALWATAFYAGLRLGELQALRWDRVDLAAGVIRVEASWDSHERAVIDVKSTAGERRVPIAAVLRERLLDLKLDGGGEGLVFGREAEVPFLGNNVHSRSVTAWKKEKLTPIGFHEARHTFASLMIAAGVNVKAISTYMGHASVKITLDTYGHLMPNSEQETAAALDEYLVRASLAPVSRQSHTPTSGFQRITADSPT